MYEIHWSDRDNQGGMPGGEFATLDEAKESAIAFIDEMIENCANSDEQRQAILDGSISCVDGDSGALHFVDSVRDVGTDACCTDCGHPAEERTCDDCGAVATVIDCGHSAQPCEIAASEDGLRPVCSACAGQS